jgi:hypothetical protein
MYDFEIKDVGVSDAEMHASLSRLFDKYLSFKKVPSKPLVERRVPGFAKQESEIDAMRIPHLPNSLTHDLTSDALPAAVGMCRHAADATDLDRLRTKRRAAQNYSRVANDIIVVIDAEHAAVSTRPDHIPPRQRRDDLWRPDGSKKARSGLPTLIAIHDLDAIIHKDQATPPLPQDV